MIPKGADRKARPLGKTAALIRKMTSVKVVDDTKGYTGGTQSVKDEVVKVEVMKDEVTKKELKKNEKDTTVKAEKRGSEFQVVPQEVGRKPEEDAMMTKALISLEKSIYEGNKLLLESGLISLARLLYPDASLHPSTSLKANS